MRILAVAILLLFAGARSGAQLVSNERTMTLGTLEFTSSVAFVDDAKIIQTVVRVTNRGRDTTRPLLLLGTHVCRAPRKSGTIHDGWSDPVSATELASQ